MPCFNPLHAIQSDDNKIIFRGNETYPQSLNKKRDLQLACGQCIGCRLARSKNWAMRCVHEAQMHEKNSFITLTYDDDNLPGDRSLDYKHFQKFIHRLRYSIKPTPIRFYMAGEYGEKFDRPHFHAIIFGYDFPDKKFWQRTASGSDLYRSSHLESLWPYGYSSVGLVTFESAAYVARYCVKKITGEMANAHYTDLETGVIRKPEFNKMSLKPGIGQTWLQKYHSDIYPHDQVIHEGRKMRPPRYYDNVWANMTDPYTVDELDAKRTEYLDAINTMYTPGRLEAIRENMSAGLKLKKRKLT